MFLSMIIPVYNTERFISSCLDSCLDQNVSKDDYEIICINDGSADNSLSVLKAYAEKYPNVVVIDKTNGGVCAARNAGLDAARAEHIMFIDSDDMIAKNVLKAVKERLEETNCGRLTVGLFEGESRLVEEIAAGGKEVPPNRSSSYLVTSILRADIIKEHNIRFVEGITHGEDILFLFEYMNYCRDAVSLPRTVYFYRRNPDSVTNTTNEKNLINCINSLFTSIALMKERYSDPVFRNAITLEFWANSVGGLLNELPKLEPNEARVYEKRAAASDVCPKIKPGELKKEERKTARTIRRRAACYRFFIFFLRYRIGHTLLTVRKKYHNSTLGYILTHPRRFIKNPKKYLSGQK